MKHKHYDLIVAWAEGKEIEYKDYDSRWYVINNPMWHNLTEYRIKPEPQQEQEPQYLYLYRHIDTWEKLMSTTLMQDTSDWDYIGKVRLEK
jgi:hypothetical protein